jgi:hypothetical protein
VVGAVEYIPVMIFCCDFDIACQLLTLYSYLDVLMFY